MQRIVNVVFLFSVAASSAAAQEAPVVYARCKRTFEPAEISRDVVVNGQTVRATRLVKNWDAQDNLPDVGRFYGNFSAPCDLALHHPDGREEVLFDCSSTSTDDAACAALDPAVSFDGQTIAFAVFRGPLLTEQLNLSDGFFREDADTPDRREYQPGPTKVLRSTEAQLHLVDVATGVVTPLSHTAGVFDSGPAWLSDGRLAFTSTRGQVHRTDVDGPTDVVSQIYSCDIDMKNCERSSHHALGGEQHPLQLVDGRVAYASWQLFGNLPYRTTNGAPGGFGTIHNMFHIFAQHPDGAHQGALYGMHITKHPSALRHPNHKAAHFLGQTGDGRVWTVDYYRLNNHGLGHVLGFVPPPEGQEGFGLDEVTAKGDFFRPREFFTLAAWATSQDASSNPNEALDVTVPGYASPLAFFGKLGHPSAYLDGHLLVVWGKGVCSTQPPQFDAYGLRGLLDALGKSVPTGPYTGGLLMNEWLGLDNPICDAGIYRTSVIPSSSPNDLVAVVDSPEWHEIMGRAVVPYQQIFGVEKPAVIPRADKVGGLPAGTPFALLGASSMIHRETRPKAGVRFEGEEQLALQGGDVIDYSDDEICGVRILAVQPNRSGNEFRAGLRTTVGERVVILGEVPVRNHGSNGEPLVDALGNPDTSFLLSMPANTPYLMQGIDCQGRTLNTDQTWQHLRPGERKTCNGCHVHSNAGMPFDGTAASSDTYLPVQLGRGQVPLMTGGPSHAPTVQMREGYGLQVAFERDILPIFQTRCGSCHSGTAPAAGLDLTLPGGDAGSTYACLVNDKRQNCVPQELRVPAGTLRRPNVSRYVRLLNSRGSLLYWKASGARTDNRTDDTYTAADGEGLEDVDFGAAHPTDMTPNELALLSRWIDTGAGTGAPFLTDTTDPVLNVAAEVAGDAVTALLVGTVDVPSGIDAASLEVCVLVDDVCQQTFTPAAEPHGTTRIELSSPISDVSTEVRATVRDLAGNATTVQITIGRLLDAPPPGVEQPPRPPGGSDGGTDLPGDLPDGGTSTDGPDGGSGPVGGGPDGGLVDPPGGGAGVEGCTCGAQGSTAVFAWVLAAWALRRRRRGA